MAASADRPDPWKTLGKLVAALAAAGVLVAGFLLPYVGGLGLVAGAEADKFDNTACNLQESKPPQRTTLYARDGKTVLATLFSQDRVEIGLDQVPQVLQDALVATEDRRFYTHHGVDMRGLLRSAVSTTGGETQGGSTLTMQYVKQIRYYEAGDDVKKQAAAIEQNLNRKIEDAKCAIYIEENLKESKQTILQNYLNIAFFGENAYGLQTAARTYFNKPASKLTLEESALLVGLLRAPSAYDPFVNRVAAKERRDQVIQNLVAVGKLTQAQADAYKAKPISLATDAPPRVKQGCANSSTSIQNAGFFCEYVRDWLGRTGLSAQQLQTGGYKIVTTLDPTIQNSAQKRIAKSVPASSPYTASLPVVDPKTGDILAMAASKQYGTGKNETEQPIFTAQVASGASTFKLFPLLAALNVGVPSDWTLDSTDGSADGKYRARNCLTPATAVNDERRQFNRNESLGSATAKSSNTFFVAFADQFLGCNVSPIVNVATQLGITSFAAKENKNQTVGQYIVSQQQALRLVLGNVETSPLEITGAYAGIANQGKFNAPAPVLSITDSDGNALPVKRTAGTQVVAPIVADQAVQILEGDTKGDGTSSDVFGDWYSAGGSDIAGKTGTAVAIPTSKNGAIWFAGMTPDLVATAAIINYDNPNKPNSGLPGVKSGVAYGDYAAKVWLDSLGSTLKGQDWTWESPDSAQGVDVPDVSGDSLSAAQRTLTDAGFRFVRLNADDDLLCPSSEPLNTVGYYGPSKAPAGSTITVCSSLGKSQPIYTAPQPVRQQPRSNAPRTGTSSSAPSSPAAGSGGRGNSGGPGGGNGGGGNGGGGGGGNR